MEQVLSVKKNNIDGQNNTVASKPVDPMALAQLAHQTRNLLAFHLEIGLNGYPATPELRQFLVRKQQPVPARQRSGSRLGARPDPPPMQGRPAPGKSAKPVPPSPAISAESASRDLKIIGQELTDCRICPSATTVKVPGQGSPTPRLFVIGDCFIGNEPQKEVIWGTEEDDLFWKMMAAIGLDRQSVYVSNCVKCCRNKVITPDDESALRCFSYLERELLAIQPALICTMGDIATRLLLKNQSPLVRLRGRFHQYRYPQGNRARVMPTFHPRFLLEHEEMKRATWEDLQALQHQLPDRSTGA